MIRTQPAYRQLEGLLEREIASGTFPEGGAIPTISQLAKEHGVSEITVISALRRLKSRGLLEARQGHGTFVRHGAAGPKPVAIYQSFTVLGERCSSYHAQCLVQVTRKLHAAGFPVRHYLQTRGENSESSPSHPLHEAVSQLRSDAEAGLLGGAILLGGHEGHIAFEACREVGVPVVTTGASPCRVLFDPESLMQGCTLLAERGVRRAAVLGCWFHSEPEREGWLARLHRGMEAVGIGLDPAHVHLDYHTALPGAGWSGLREIFTKPGKSRPDGLLITDEFILGDVLRALREMRLDPFRDLAIVSQQAGPTDLPLLAPIDCLVAEVPMLAKALTETLVQQIEAGGTLQIQRRLSVSIQRSLLHSSASEAIPSPPHAERTI